MSTPVSIALEIEVAGDTVTGSCDDGTGGRREFSGWLGLMSAIEALVPAAGEEPPTGRSE